MRNRPFLKQWLWWFAAALTMLVVQPLRAEEDFLDPEVAFKLAARALDERTVEVVFTVAPGYYLYGEQFGFAASGATLGGPVLPAGKTKFDETFQKMVETHRGVLRIAIPVLQAGSRFQMLVTNQGCADKGLCYPPQQRAIEISLAGFGGDGSARVMSPSRSVAVATGALPASGAAMPPVPFTYASDDASIDAALRSGRLWSVVGVFFVAGVLLSLTPCVLPMLPILSSIIVGQGPNVSRGRGLALAASYSLGMALVYTAFGVAAGLAGEGLAAALQRPWVLAAFSTGLVMLAMSMFGVYQLHLPSDLSGRLSAMPQKIPGGRFAGVFAMGAVSALIVSPCVAAPLAGALVYLSQTRDVPLGGAALFSMAAGMSVPLLLTGVSAGALLPRAGPWMDDLKRLFGVLLLGVALWTVRSILPAALTLALWGALAIGAALVAGSTTHDRRTAWTSSGARRAIAAVLAAWGLLQLVGAASGGSDPLQPLVHLRVSTRGAAVESLVFVPVHSLTELDAALRTAGRPVMLDFYADWCVSCKEMERLTFVDPAVQKKMSAALLLRADVTANSTEDRALLGRFNLFGPPATIFFDAQARELGAARIAGFQNRERFLQTLQAAGL